MSAQVVPVPGLEGPKVPLPGADSTEGVNNTDWDKSQDRIIKGHSYRDCGVVCIIPTRDGNLDHRFVASFDGLIKPPNHPFAKWIVANMEVGDAFNRAIWTVINNPDLMKWNGGKGPVIFTCEDDQILPADTLMKLLATFHSTPYAAVSALYWTKGIGGVPQLWGNPKEFPLNYAPQVPIPGTVQEVRGIGMGAAVWDIGLFTSPNTRQGVGPDGVPVWFKTWQEVDANGVPRVSTQDLSFCEVAQKAGFRFAVNTDIRVGHLEKSSGIVW